MSLRDKSRQNFRKALALSIAPEFLEGFEDRLARVGGAAGEGPEEGQRVLPAGRERGQQQVLLGSRLGQAILQGQGAAQRQKTV